MVFLYNGMNFFAKNNSLLYLLSSASSCSGYPFQQNINIIRQQFIRDYWYQPIQKYYKYHHSYNNNINNNNIDIDHYHHRRSSCCTYLQTTGCKRRRTRTRPSTTTEFSRTTQRIKKSDSLLFGIPLQNSNAVAFSDTTDSTIANEYNGLNPGTISVIDTSTTRTSSTTTTTTIVTGTSTTGSTRTVGQRGKRGNNFYSKYNVSHNNINFNTENTENTDNNEQKTNHHIRFVRYRARVAYDGTNFAGFQLQSTPSTVSLSSSINLNSYNNNNTTSNMNTNNTNSSNNKNANRRSRRKALLRDSNVNKTIINNNKNNNNNQNEKRTVQGVLENILTQRLLHKCINNNNVNDDTTTISIIRVIAAGRTDAGVHANGQAIHFDIPILYEKSTTLKNQTNTGNINNNKSYINYETPTIEQLHTIEYSINQMLPYDIRLYNLQVAPSYVTKQPKQQQQQRNQEPLTDITTDTSRLQSLSNTTFNDDSSCKDNDTTMFLQKNYTWNVMYDSTHKLYSYRLSFDKVMDPIERYNRWHPDWYISHTTTCPYNVQHLEQLLQYYVGTHDFRAFAGSIDRLESKMKSLLSSQVQAQQQQDGEDTTTVVENNDDENNKIKLLSLVEHPLNTIRTVYSITLVKEDDDNNKNNYRIDFIVKGALYKQIRNMVGTVLDVCRGRMTETKFRSLLMLDNNNNSSNSNSTDATSSSNTLSTAPITQQQQQQKKLQKQSRCDNPSKPAPAHGLTLEYVYFDNDPTGF